MNIDRRNFLKATGLTFSGALLSACATNPNPAPPTQGTDGVLPNGYQFYSIKHNTDILPGGTRGQTLRLDAAIDSHGRVVYGAMDSQDRIGLYALQLDLSVATPRVSSESRIVRIGDMLDGRRVVELNNHDINAKGQLAIVVRVETEMSYNTTDEHGSFDGGTAPMKMQAIYCDLGQGLTRVLHEHVLNTDGHEFAGMFGDLNFHENDLIFVANYYHNTGQVTKDVRQGVFLLRGLEGKNASLVVTSGTSLAASTSAPTISQFGLISLHDGGQFVLQAMLTPASEFANQYVQGAQQTAVLRGNLNTVSPATRKTGSPSNLRVEASSISSGLRSSSTRASGLTCYAPRSGPNSSFAHVINNGSQHTLVVNNRVVMQSGDRSPTGNTVKAIATPQLATDGITFFMVETSAGIELLASNGSQSRTILKTGDLLVNHPSPVSDFIGVGYSAMHSDDEGRLVFVVIHEDDSQSLVLGLPV